LARHNPEERVHWCGIHFCPYPYISTIAPPDPALKVPKHVSVLKKEEPEPSLHGWRLLNPRWGAYVRMGPPREIEPDEDKETPTDREMAKGW